MKTELNTCWNQLAAKLQVNLDDRDLKESELADKITDDRRAIRIFTQMENRRIREEKVIDEFRDLLVSCGIIGSK